MPVPACLSTHETDASVHGDGDGDGHARGDDGNSRERGRGNDAGSRRAGRGCRLGSWSRSRARRAAAGCRDRLPLCVGALRAGERRVDLLCRQRPGADEDGREWHCCLHSQAAERGREREEGRPGERWERWQSRGERAAGVFPAGERGPAARAGTCVRSCADGVSGQPVCCARVAGPLWTVRGSRRGWTWRTRRRWWERTWRQRRATKTGRERVKANATHSPSHASFLLSLFLYLSICLSRRKKINDVSSLSFPISRLCNPLHHESPSPHSSSA